MVSLRGSSQQSDYLPIRAVVAQGPILDPTNFDDKLNESAAFLAEQSHTVIARELVNGADFQEQDEVVYFGTRCRRDLMEPSMYEVLATLVYKVSELPYLHSKYITFLS